MTASGCVPCESLTKRTPSMSGDRLESMLDAREGRGGLADGVRRDAEEQPDGDRGQGVRDVVGAGDGELADRHDPAARAGGRDAAAGHGSRWTPAATIQPSTTPRPPGIGASRWYRTGVAVPRAAYPETTGSSASRTSAPSGSTSSASRRLTWRYASTSRADRGGPT